MSKALDSLKRKALTAVLNLAKQWCFKKIDELFGTTSTEPSAEEEQAGDTKLNDEDKKFLLAAVDILNRMIERSGFQRIIINDSFTNQRHIVLMHIKHKPLK